MSDDFRPSTPETQDDVRGIPDGLEEVSEPHPKDDDAANVNSKFPQTGGAISEDGVARAFARTYAGHIVFDHTQQRWFAWTGARWQRDETDSVFNLARKFCRIAMKRTNLSKPPSSMAKIAFAGNVERAARSDPPLAVTYEVWDRDPWLLGVPDGVIDLRTGSTMPPDPARFISRETSVAPAPPGTRAPIWKQFLDEATGGDADFVHFLQKLCGYMLTGLTHEEIVAFFYGPGGNGKGTFLRPISQIMNAYAGSIPIEAFSEGRHINLEYYRAQMNGRRLITTAEPEAGAHWSESSLKEISGNETALSARHPYGKPFQFHPVCKIVAVGNFAPKLKGRSPAMERRLRVCPFDRVPAKPDLNLKERLIIEYPGILRWMINGALAWQREGLGTCTAVAAASEHYFTAMDAVTEWLDEYCVLDQSLSTPPSALLASFNAWAKAGGRDTIDAVAFAEVIDRTPSLTRTRAHGKRLVRGIGLRAPTGAYES